MATSNLEIIAVATYGYNLAVTVQTYNTTTEEWEADNISGFTTRNYLIRRPDGTLVTLAASFVTDGTDGQLTATASQSDNVFNQKGYYQVQVQLANATQSFLTSVFGFDVDDAL